MTLEPCAINNLLFTVLSYDFTVSGHGRLGLVQYCHLVEVGEALWMGPVVDIQVTEWVNVKNKISYGEKMVMWARPSHWHDFRIYY